MTQHSIDAYLQRMRTVDAMPAGPEKSEAHRQLFGQHQGSYLADPAFVSARIQNLADITEALGSDGAIQQARANWGNMDQESRLAVLQRIADITNEHSGIRGGVPRIPVVSSIDAGGGARYGDVDNHGHSLPLAQRTIIVKYPIDDNFEGTAYITVHEALHHHQLALVEYARTDPQRLSPSQLKQAEVYDYSRRNLRLGMADEVDDSQATREQRKENYSNSLRKGYHDYTLNPLELEAHSITASGGPDDQQHRSKDVRMEWSAAIGNADTAARMAKALQQFGQQMQSPEMYQGRAMIALDLDFMNGEQPSVMPQTPYQPRIKDNSKAHTP